MGSGSDQVQNQEKCEPDLNQTEPLRGPRFSLRAQTGPSPGLGFGKIGLQTGPNRTVASLSCMPTVINVLLYFVIVDPALPLHYAYLFPYCHISSWTGHASRAFHTDYH
jgi:hypothetical protein